jgi:hypothetical protein
LNVLKALIPVALVVAAAAPLAAQDAQVGGQAALAFPVNDLTNIAELGLTVGAHARWDFGHGHGLMARGDVALYGSKNGFNTNSYAAGADYTYHIDHNRRGLYFLGGLSFMTYSVSHGGSNHSGLGISLGAGYDLTRNLGLQMRYTTHSVDHGTFSSLNLGATYTF